MPAPTHPRETKSSPESARDMADACTRGLRRMIKATEDIIKHDADLEEIIAGLRQEIDKLSVLVSGQAYEIKKLEARLANEKESVPDPDAEQEAVGPDDQDDEEAQRGLFGRMAARKMGLLAGQPANPPAVSSQLPTEWTKSRKEALIKAIIAKNLADNIDLSNSAE